MKRQLSRLTSAFFLVAAASVMTAAQTSDLNNLKPTGTPSNATVQTDRTIADEDFELNIAERRITERDFAASTSVEVGEETARGLLLRVGVAVGADEINVLLRNVRGRVRFRASLARVLERLNSRRNPGAVP